MTALAASAGRVRAGAPHFSPRARRLAAGLLGVALVGAAAALLVPQVADMRATVARLGNGDLRWLALGVGLEALSFAGYVVLFRTVFGSGGIGWGRAYRITMSGLFASRLFGAAGAGGVALTAWALRRSGLGVRTITHRMTAFLVLLYGLYMGALVVGGFGLLLGLFPGSAPVLMTALPAALGGLAIALALALTLLPEDLERRLAARTGGRGFTAKLAAVPSSLAEGVRTALELVRSPSPGLLGAVAAWGFEIAVLWASFQAFGEPPAVAVVVMAYFVGMVANTLPLPGGIGGVEGGMIGAFLAFGVDGGLALLAVLAYRAVAYWLPMIPGALAYVGLRRTLAAERPAESTAAA